MKIQKLLAPLRRAINDYNMIEAGDKVAVGLSGGKDSMVLLCLLKAFQRFSDRPFELMAVTIDPGFDADAYQPMIDYCRENDIKYVIEKTDIADIVFNQRKESNPCSLCSKMRRGALNTILRAHGFNKLALGHHMNDIVDTFMLSLFHEGRLSTMAPISYMDRSGISVIRPMIYINEYNSISLSKNLPVVHNPCPANKNTERESMKNILKSLSADYPGLDEKFARAIMHPERYNLWNGMVENYENHRKSTQLAKQSAEEGCCNCKDNENEE